MISRNNNSYLVDSHIIMDLELDEALLQEGNDQAINFWVLETP